MKLLGKWQNSHLSPRKLLISGVAITLMIVVTFVTLIAAAKWDVTLNDNGNIISISTTKSTVGAMLAQEGIVLADDDYVVPSLDTPISEAREVTIRRAFDIVVCDANGEKVLKTARPTVGEALLACGIIFDENDEIMPSVDTQTVENMKISIARIEVCEVSEEQEINYEIIEEASDKLQKGAKKLVTSGKNGLANVKYRIVMRDGAEHSREEISREILQEPINKIVAVGTKENAVAVAKLASRGGSVSGKSVSKVIICRATAYDGSYETLGKTNPKTCLGRTPTVGTVAVDPRVIPLGTRMYIETVDGSYVYGECFAGDTGGAIKGNRVDLFMASRAQALSFGSRQVRVYILD